VTDEFDDIIEASRKLFPKPPLADPAGTGTAKHHNKRRDQFIIVPMAWKDRLTGAVHASTLKLALHLLHQYWKNDGEAIGLSNIALTSAGVSRGQKWRCLRELEKLGLVQVERRKRRSPLVRVIGA
jgi:hypothetical protein